jgi:hypothetical protein
MKLATLLLLILWTGSSVVSAQPLRKKPSGFDKILRSMFQPRKPTPAQKPKRKAVKQQSKLTAKAQRTFTVDPEWIARYWELQAAWDYPIPEDDQIQWKDGKYIVPLMVQKHYEDMLNTPKRPATNQPNAISPLE